MYILPTCMSTYHMCSWVPADPEKAIKYPGTGGKDSWELYQVLYKSSLSSPAYLFQPVTLRLLLPAVSPVPFLLEAPTTLAASAVLVFQHFLSDSLGDLTVRWYCSTLASQFLDLLSSNNLTICCVCPRQPHCP